MSIVALRPLGLHLLLDIAGAPFATLDDTVLIERALVEAAGTMRTNVLGIYVHRLTPQGISGVVVISESHLTVHTWPERGEAAVDLFTCGDPARARSAVKGLLARLGASRSRLREVVRGASARGPKPQPSAAASRRRAAERLRARPKPPT